MDRFSFSCSLLYLYVFGSIPVRLRGVLSWYLEVEVAYHSDSSRVSRVLACSVNLFSGCVDESASFPLKSVVCEDGSSSVFCLPCGGWKGIGCGGGGLVKYS